MQTFNDISTVVFDADDTLWPCQTFYTDAEEAFIEIMAKYADADTTADTLYETETNNMPLLGFGARAFTISLLETAVKVSRGRLTSHQTKAILQLGKELMDAPTKPFPDVEATLSTLRSADKRLVLFTKGELLDQERKIERSGLARYFSLVEIVSAKDLRSTEALCRRIDEPMERLLFVGNSFRSDIDPPLRLGAYAAFLPGSDTWQYETGAEYTHERLVVLDDIGDIPALLAL